VHRLNLICHARGIFLDTNVLSELMREHLAGAVLDWFAARRQDFAQFK
jgi:predicted nucleic acid-binding protein